MNEHTFRDGDRVRVVPRPYESEDRYLANKLAVVVDYSHANAIDEVYRVDVEGEDGFTLLYARDMVLEPELTLLGRAAKLEAELAKVKKLIEDEKQGEVVHKLPVGSAIRFTDNVTIKVAENRWHWIYIGTADEFQHHSNSDDKAIVKEQREYRSLGKVFTVHRADRD